MLIVVWTCTWDALGAANCCRRHSRDLLAVPGSNVSASLLLLSRFSESSSLIALCCLRQRG